VFCLSAPLSRDQAFEAQFSDSIDYPALYVINKAGGILGRQASLIPVDTRDSHDRAGVRRRAGHPDLDGARR
jgi:hypothetical protein